MLVRWWVWVRIVLLGVVVEGGAVGCGDDGGGDVDAYVPVDVELESSTKLPGEVPPELRDEIVLWSPSFPGQHKFLVNPDKPDGLVLQGDVVLDEHTGLMWAREFEEFTPADKEDPRDEVVDAWEYCDNLVLGGYDDWRLPTRLELLSVADHTRLRPAIDPDLFPDVYTSGRSPYWTITPHWADRQFFAIGFDDGAVTYDGDLTKPVRARCVRWAVAPEEVDQVLTIMDDTVIDHRTGLEWERLASSEKFDDADAAAEHCMSLTKAGGGFRLPSVKELNTLIDEAYVWPAVDEAVFPGTKKDWYWSSTPYHGFDGYWWAVTFKDSASYINEADYGYARCVRDAR